LQTLEILHSRSLSSSQHSKKMSMITGPWSRLVSGP
jgi:hypothetical protein